MTTTVQSVIETAAVFRGQCGECARRGRETVLEAWARRLATTMIAPSGRKVTVHYMWTAVSPGAHVPSTAQHRRKPRMVQTCPHCGERETLALVRVPHREGA